MSEPPDAFARSLKRIDLAYVRRANWFGLKNIASAILRFAPINAAATWTARRILPTQLRQRLPIRKGYVSYSLGNGAVVRLAEAHRDLVAKDIFWGGSKPAVAAEARKLRCIERLCKEAGTFLDIGAYSGICALIAAKSNQHLKVVAYEIVPENYFLLVRNIVENDLVERVEARLCGLGPADGAMTVPISLDLPSLETSFSLGSDFESGIRIPIRTLQSEVEGCQPPFVLKLDVEGYEPDVLRAGADFLREHRPDMVCEVLLTAGTARSLEQMLGFLGYRFFEIADDGIHERPAIEQSVPGRDWLFSTRSQPVGT